MRYNDKIILLSFSKFYVEYNPYFAQDVIYNCDEKLKNAKDGDRYRCRRLTKESATTYEEIEGVCGGCRTWSKNYIFAIRGEKWFISEIKIL